MTTTSPGGALQAQIDLALVPSWGNNAKYVSKVVVPKGTIIYEGVAAPQSILTNSKKHILGTLPGGGNPGAPAAPAVAAAAPAAPV